MLRPTSLTITLDFVFCRTWSTSPSRPWAVATPGGSSETRSTLNVCTTVSRILHSRFRSRPILPHHTSSLVNPNRRNRLPKEKPLPGVESKPSPRSDPSIRWSYVDRFVVSCCILHSNCKYPFYLVHVQSYLVARRAFGPPRVERITTRAYFSIPKKMGNRFLVRARNEQDGPKGGKSPRCNKPKTQKGHINKKRGFTRMKRCIYV